VQSISQDSETTQWSSLGVDLMGENSAMKRQEIIHSLDLLEQKANAELRSSTCETPDKIQSLKEAISYARKITESVLKPVDLSFL
jgi:hypothetical protein